MVTLTTAVLFLCAILIALYAFGIFSTPYTGAFRFAFYLLLVLTVLSFWFGMTDHPYEGYDPTVGAR